MAEHALKIESRAAVGTTSSRRLRAEGKVPAVLYGHGDAPRHLAVEAKALEDLLHHGGRTSLITLSGDGSSDTALIRDVQYDPVSRRAYHADFQRVSAGERVETTLPVVTIGIARGVREHGAVMDVVVHEVEIEGPADRIPDNVEVDVSELEIHGHVTAADLRLPNGFTMVTPAETVLVSIEPSKTAQALEEAAIAGPEQAQPEVIGASGDQGAAG